jgi:hypothetical protein
MEPVGNLHPRIEIEFLEDVVDMDADRLDANRERLRDLPVGVTACKQLGNLPLPPGQRFTVGRERWRISPLRRCGGREGERGGDGLFVAHGSAFHSLRRILLVAPQGSHRGDQGPVGHLTDRATERPGECLSRREEPDGLRRPLARHQRLRQP